MPLTQSVNGGNHVGAPERRAEAVQGLLGEAQEPLPEPPLDLIDAQAVLKWLDRVNAQLLFREDRRRLAREVMQVLDEDFRTVMAVERLREQLERQQTAQRARTEGTYWADRDRRQQAQQPTHVDVDLDAWRAMRSAAARRGSGVGQEVGRLVVKEVTECSGSATLPAFAGGRRGAPGEGRRARLFARLVVTKPTWQTFRGLAVVRDITIARYVGLLVENAAWREGRDR